jgi:hypothetical protein
MRAIELFGLTSIIVGWFATHLFSEARERRKEARSQLDKLIERLIKLQSSTLGFHTQATFQPNVADELLTEIARIERILSRTPLAASGEMSGLIKEYRRAISLRNFEKTSFQQQEIGSDILVGISIAAQDIEDHLEERYLARYPSKFPFFYISENSTGICILGFITLCIAVILIFKPHR